MHIIEKIKDIGFWYNNDFQQYYYQDGYISYSLDIRRLSPLSGIIYYKLTRIDRKLDVYDNWEDMNENGLISLIEDIFKSKIRKNKIDKILLKED